MNKTATNQNSKQIIVMLPPKKERGTCAVLSIAFGFIALLGCWIPYLGLLSIPIAGFGLLFGFLALLISLCGRTRFSAAMVGLLLSGLALFIAISVTGAVTAATKS